MKFLLLLFFSGLSILTQAQSKDSDIVGKTTDTLPTHYLAPVTVHTSTYKADSIQNRADYKAIFNYKKEKINMGDNKWNRTIVSMGQKVTLKPQENLSVLDISALMHNIHSKKEERKLALKKRLIQQEQDDYVLQIFTPALVERFSNMHDDDSLHVFIAKYAPSFYQIQIMNELDLGDYVLKKMKLFRQYHLATDSINNK